MCIRDRDNAVDDKAIIIYKENNDFVIKANETIKAINVYDASGKLVEKYNSNAKVFRVNNTKYQSGVYNIDIHTCLLYTSRCV